MMEFAHELILAGIALVIGAITWVLKKEHSRIEALEVDHVGLNERLSKAITENAKNDERRQADAKADKEWRKRVHENHKGLLKADEDRRGDARKIYDKISDQKDEINKEIQRLGELVAGKK